MASFGIRFIIAVSLVLVASAPSAGADVDRLVIFGDSLSDPGNHFVAFGTASQAPFAPLPDFPYAIGGHHFSNGATWAEQLSRALGMPTSGRPALQAPGVFTNYAVGRARAREAAPVFPQFDLGAQVQQFVTDMGGHVPASALYVIWIGGNDLNDALTAGQADPAAAATIIQSAVTAVAANVHGLWSVGARNFLVLNIPDPALAPFVRALGPAVQAAASQTGLLYNAALEQALSQVDGLPGIHITRFDTRAAFDHIVATLGDASLSNVIGPCLTFGVVDAVCEHPNQYLFWDAAHPTKAGHRLISEAVERLFHDGSE